ncbi:HNH nuclease [uncultured Caudovirales phage]|uniref:HNH nuclease n=1 Tax=uncultured Caudovirales phage TaxID=2100421 RepID=A0A6J5NJZ6_9CAUD|nr:HNH nuclease [uncultured Caudovirales phage]
MQHTTSAEEWRTIKSCSTHEASSLGRIRRATPGRRTFVGRIMSPNKDKDGYFVVCIQLNGKRRMLKVHRLVCEAFHGPPPFASAQAAHRDGSRDNNVPDNLRWATNAENCHDRKLHGTNLSGSQHGRAKLTEDAVMEIRSLRGRISQYALAETMRVSQSTISAIQSRRIWAHLP